MKKHIHIHGKYHITADKYNWTVQEFTDQPRKNDYRSYHPSLEAALRYIHQQLLKDGVVSERTLTGLVRLSSTLAENIHIAGQQPELRRL